jgi:hypothetical protein
MRRLWFSLSLLVGLVLLAGGLLSGPLATRCLHPLIGAIEKNSEYTLSVERARLTLNGEVYLSQVVFGKKGAPRTRFSQVKINPRWISWIKGRFEIESLSVILGDGALTGQGTITHRPFSFNFQGTADRVPLEQVVRIYRDIPISIQVAHTGQWRCSGTPQKWNVSAEGHLERGLIATPSSTHVSCVVDFEGHKGTVALTLARQESEVKTHVKLDMQKEWLEGDFKVTAAPLSSFDTLWPELSQTQGTLVATGHLVGPWTSLGGTIELNGSRLRYKNFAVKNLQAQFDQRGAKDQPFILSVIGSSITWTNAEGKAGGLTRAEMGWEGTTQQGDLSWNVYWDKGTSVKGKGPAQRKGQGLSWSWKNLELLFASGEKYSAVPGGTLDLLSAEQLDVRNLRIGNQGQTLLVRRFSFNKQKIAVESSAEQFHLIIPGTSLTGWLSGEVLLQGPMDNPEGHFDLSVTGGSYGNLTGISGKAKGRVEKGLVTFSEAKMATASLPSLRARGTLPWSWIIGSDFSQPMDIGFETGRLDPVELLINVPNSKVASGGGLQLDGRVVGPKESISVEGTATASLPLFEIPSYGIFASETNIDLEIKDRHLRVRKAETNLGKGRVIITGEGDLPSLNLKVEGTKISLLIRRQLELLGDFHLELGGTLAVPHLKGTLAIAQGTYERAKKKKNEDVSLEKNGALKRFWDSLKMNVQAEWPNNVWYRDGLTKIETKADLEVIKETGNSMPGFQGLISLLKGNYDAYGRDFVLKTGELTFTDLSEIDPQLNVHATHKMKNYLIDLTVLGTAKKPDLQFQSTPPLQEQDILALLALGKVPGQSASQGSTPSDGAPSEAAELAADVVSNYLTREIRSAGMNVLDLDVVRVSPSEKGNEWTVGRYWGSKLFLSYSYNPEDAANQVLKGEYSLTPRWTVVGQTGSQTDNYLDLTFRVPVGKSRKGKN